LTVDTLRRGDQQRVRAAQQAALIQALAEMHDETRDM
jgi:hypothetical protein